jgi:thioredoxin-like negative regulator of GroEL
MPIQNIILPDNAQTKFKNILKKGTVVSYYHWKLCGHCKAFAPLWKKITRQYKDKILFANIELEGMKGIDEYYKVQGFPSIIIYKNGKKKKEFTGERTAERLDAFLKKYVIDVPKRKEKYNKTDVKNEEQ